MADTRLSTDNTPQPIQETSNPTPTLTAKSNRILAAITETILESFRAHDNRMRAAGKRPPKVARRIRRIILRSPLAHRSAPDEPYRLIVAVNRLPVQAEAWRAGVTATLTERLGVPVHITLIKAQWLLRQHPALRPFFQAMDASHELLYADDGNHPAPEAVMEDSSEGTPGGGQDGGPDNRHDEPDLNAIHRDEKRWWGELEMHLYDKVKAREEERAAKPAPGGSGLPGPSVMLAMEEPLYRLTCASVLLRDLAYIGLETDDTPRAMGLHFFAHALTRETDVLYRLYHGKPSAR